MAKILHISKYYYPYYGGIEDAAQTIVNELKLHHIQKVICFNDKNQSEKEYIDGVEVIRVATIGSLFSQPIPRYYIATLRKLLKKFNPDYIHLHLPNPIVAMALQRVGWDKAKLYVHWHADITGQKLLYSLYKPYEKKLLLKADKIIATSQIYLEYSQVVKRLLYKSLIVPNTVNEQKFISSSDDNDEIEKIRQKYGNKKILFFVGRHVPYKGIDHIIECEKMVKEDCVFVIAGKGLLTKKLKKMAGDSRRIHFVGKLSDKELYLYLRASYLYLFPSLNRSEAFGIALAEALYCGLPAISYHIEGSGVNWVNKHNYSGLVVANADTKAFADAISELLCNPEQRNKMSTNASAWARENFLIEKAFTNLHDIYQDKPFADEFATNVSIVLYNNCFEEVQSLVYALRQNSKVADIFLVDNSKTIDERYKTLNATYIFNNKNVGYGRGHNVALRQTLCRKNAAYHIVMNADVKFAPDIISNIINYLHNHKEVGALMPKVFYPNNKIQYLCRLLPTPIDLFGRRFLPKCFMKSRLERLEMRHTDYNQIIEVPHLSGCFMAINVEVLQKSGLFDERYFLYLEDVDLTRRIGKYAKTVFYPSVHIVHEHRRGSYNNIYLLLRHISSATKYFRKWGIFSDTAREEINRKILKTTNFTKQ